jgi:DNA repair exonuclease SbcCD nuclease subunit
MGESFRFLHAGQLHLEQPVSGLAEIPPHLRDALIEAPLTSAAKVFDAAVGEEVDFVLLTGDVVHPQLAGPRVLSFLLDQFDKMQQHDIAVYWVGGEVDTPDRWPESVGLPLGVHYFSANQVEEISHMRGDAPIATILGKSYNGRRQIVCSEFRADTAQQFIIAAAYGTAPADAIDASSVGYWALGGAQERATVVSTQHMTAHYCGTPQSRSVEQTGAQGCTVVTVDGEGRTRTKMIACDAIRWEKERISLDSDATKETLIRRLQERVQSLSSDCGDRPVLVEWIVQCEGALGRKLRGGAVTDEIVADLRRRYGEQSPSVWSARMTATLPSALPSTWYEEDTIRGDYLRAVRRFQSGGPGLIDLQKMLSANHDAGLMNAVTDLNYVETPEGVLREAEATGADLLSGEVDAA